MKRFDVQTRYPDDLASQTIGLLRWALMALIVVIHTNLVADTGCSGTVYGNLYRWADNVVWLASPLFFLISGYLFVASDGGFSWQAFTVKCRRRLRTWVAPCWLICCCASFCRPYAAGCQESKWFGKKEIIKTQVKNRSKC